MKNLLLIAGIFISLGCIAVSTSNGKAQLTSDTDVYIEVEDTTKKETKKKPKLLKKLKKGINNLSGEGNGNGQTKLTVNEEGVEEEGGESKKEEKK